MQSPRLSRRTLRNIARTTTIATIVGVGLTGIGLAPSAGAGTNPTVTLTVNGRSSTLVTTAPTVGGLLSDESVHYDSNDLINPGTATSITDGLDVKVRSAVAVSIVHKARSVKRVIPALTANGLKQQLKLRAAGSSPRARTYQDESFQRLHVYGPNGRSLVGSDRVPEGSRVVVSNVRVVYAQSSDRFFKQVKKDRTHLLSRGTVHVKKRGHAGRAQVLWRKRFIDNELISKQVVQRKVVRQAARRVVLSGTGPNWRGLARCESGGNPNAVNPAGYYGLYQFSLSTWHAVGGTGNPIDHNYWEQTKRAWILYKGSGSSPWPVCGRFL